MNLDVSSVCDTLNYECGVTSHFVTILWAKELMNPARVFLFLWYGSLRKRRQKWFYIKLFQYISCV